MTNVAMLLEPTLTRAFSRVITKSTSRRQEQSFDKSWIISSRFHLYPSFQPQSQVTPEFTRCDLTKDFTGWETFSVQYGRMRMSMSIHVDLCVQEEVSLYRSLK